MGALLGYSLGVGTKQRKIKMMVNVSPSKSGMNKNKIAQCIFKWFPGVVGYFFFIKKLMEKRSLQNGSFFHPFLLRLLVPLFKVSSRTIYNSNKKEEKF